MKKGVITILTISILVFGSFGVIGNNIETKDECNCGNNYVLDEEIIKDLQANQYSLGLIYESPEEIAKKIPPAEPLGNAPSSWDWRNVDGKDWTTPIRDQAECGSCYAFAVMAVLETVYNINKNNPNLDIDLSEQYMVSCGQKQLPFDIHGCCGGTFAGSIAFIEEQGTIEENSFAYKAIDANGRDGDECDHLYGSHEKVKCPNVNGPIYKASRAKTLFTRNGMKNAINEYGPLVTSMYVYDDFPDYNGGIYVKNSNRLLGGHMVAIVGYNDDPGYWICKNSWGTEWGEDGWFRIKYGECSIDLAFTSAYFTSCIKPRIKNYDFFSFFENPLIMKFLIKLPFF